MSRIPVARVALTNRPAASTALAARIVLLSIGALIMVYPFLWMISGSFKDVRELFRIPPTLVPRRPTLANYEIVIEKMTLLGAMYLNSAIVASSIALLQALICSMAAFVLAKLEFVGKKVVFVAFISSLMIPPQLTIIPNYIIIRQLGLIDSIFSLVALGAFSAFAVFLMRQFFMTIPRDLNDAARIDGCGVVRSYALVHLPLAQPVLAVNSILCFNAAWGDYFGPLIFLKTLRKMTLPLGITLIQGVYRQGSPSVLVATLVLSIIPVVVVFLLGRRKIIEGITMTGMKL